MFKIGKVNSQIIKSAQWGQLVWYRGESLDYICGGPWAMKIDLKEERYRKILSKLVERFGVIPRVGETSRISGREVIEVDKAKQDWIDTVEGEQGEILIDTNLIHFKEAGEMKIFKGEEYIYINNKYIEMVDIKDVIIKSKGNLNPIFFCKEDEVFLILPIRMPEGNEHLKEIGDKKDSKGLQSQKSQ